MVSRYCESDDSHARIQRVAVVIKRIPEIKRETTKSRFWDPGEFLTAVVIGETERTWKAREEEKRKKEMSRERANIKKRFSLHYNPCIVDNIGISK